MAHGGEFWDWGCPCPRRARVPWWARCLSGPPRRARRSHRRCVGRRVQGFRIYGFSVHGLGAKVLSLGFRVQGLGLMD